MTGLEKILADIRQESDAASAEQNAKADARIQETLDAAKKRADDQQAKLRAETQTRAGEIAARAESAAELDRRRRLLAEKQALISQAIDAALQKARELPDEAYFKTLVKMAADAAHPDAGELRLGAKDLARLPADFSQRLSAALKAPASLRVSQAPAPIDSGFVLVYGGVEENCTFEAVFAARREQLQDKAREILFS
jgi:V/A-type H+-transporting ATPase subunit E